MEHLIKPNLVTLENILTRLMTRDNILHQDITVLVETEKDTAAAAAWLVNHFSHTNTQVQVKTVDQFRGMESPVLVFVSDSGGYSGLAPALEGLTRVTSRLIIVHKDTRGGLGLSEVLPEMVKQGLVEDVTNKYKQTTANTTKCCGIL